MVQTPKAILPSWPKKRAIEEFPEQMLIHSHGEFPLTDIGEVQSYSVLLGDLALNNQLYS